MPNLPEISPAIQTTVPSEREYIHNIENHSCPFPASDFRAHEEFIAEAFERELLSVDHHIPTSDRPSESALSVATARTKTPHEWSCDISNEERRGSIRFSAHVHSVAILVSGSGRSWSQLAGLAKVGIVSVACVSTFLRWLVAFNGIGLFSVCTDEDVRAQEVLTYRLIFAIMTVGLGSLIVVWLLMRASTPDTRQVAVFLVSVSLLADLSAWRRIDECFGEEPKSYGNLLYIVFPFAYCGTVMQYAGICITRLATLQTSAIIRSNSKAMRRVGWCELLLTAAVYLSLDQLASAHEETLLFEVVFCCALVNGLFVLAWFTWIVHGYYIVLPTLLQGVRLVSGLYKQEIVRALKTHAFQLAGVTMTVSIIWLIGMIGGIYYTFDRDTYSQSVWFQWIEACLLELLCPALYFSGLLFSGAFFGVLSRGRKRREKEFLRECRWNWASRKWRKTNRVLEAPGRTINPARLSAPDRQSSQQSTTILPTIPSADWRTKVVELANRGVSLAAMLRFYRVDLREAMPDYSSSKHTTRDVVRRAIIPLSREACSSYASVMMHGQRVKPKKMVTHNWGNLFRDLLAAVLSDALEEHEYGKLAQLLDHDVETIERWINHKGISGDAYWICAFSISQHDGICSSNPLDERDTVSGEPYPMCDCGKSKFFNATPPTYKGKSINCEMNKFDEMIAYLSAQDSQFSQVIVVDAKFQIFGRAWCVAELATAHAMGMKQNLKVVSAEGLDAHSESLRGLRVQDMQASRPEDVQEILATIPDKDRFNKELQSLVFESLLVDWKNLDATAQMVLVGRVVRWQAVALKSVGA